MKTFLPSILLKIKATIIIALTLFSLSFAVYPTLPAQAVIRQQAETPTQVLFQARHRLTDSEGDTWQVILFKRVKAGEVKGIELRLVAFPQTVTFRHPQALTVKTATGKTLTASDQFAHQSPGANIGQYDLQGMIKEIVSETSVRLELPLVEKSRLLKIPYAVLLEWQDVAL